ncbi:unnamed protein product [Clavelina lepadiformis]|uniref:Uncharacterized protein n=1 Tax=Clavelina lepadiformis TaxID=159417 RepID=A0ABP0FJ86_CLALP
MSWYIHQSMMALYLMSSKLLLHHPVPIMALLFTAFLVFNCILLTNIERSKQMTTTPLRPMEVRYVMKSLTLHRSFQNQSGLRLKYFNKDGGPHFNEGIILEANSSSERLRRKESNDIAGIFQPITSQSTINRIRNILQNLRHNRGLQRIAKIWNCTMMQSIRTRDNRPIMTTQSLNLENEQLDLVLPDEKIVRVILKTFRVFTQTKATVSSQTSFDPLSDVNDPTDDATEREAENLLKILKLQGVPGIPRVFGVCVVNEDMTSLGDQPQHSLSYVMERYDDVMPLFLSQSPLKRFIKYHPSPGPTVAKIIRNVAKLFEALFLNGIFPAKLSADEIVVTRSYDVKVTSTEYFVSLQSSSTTNFKRALSDLSCRSWDECAALEWNDHDRGIPGAHKCQDFRGHCSTHNRCWGYDTSVHLCVYSRWIFKELIDVIPASWKGKRLITSLLTCTGQPDPEYRCDWTYLHESISKIISDSSTI